MRSILATSLALLLAGPVAPAAEDTTLAIGDAAPALADVTWVKGGPLPAFAPGKTYVLDFWATWCGPCRASIPHLNELAQTRREKNVQVVGVAIWPSDTMVPTADFVADKGDEMDYLICEDVDGKIATAYMEASGQGGIPTAMVIDGTGRIAWIGHPLDGLQDVVDKVVAGTWDAKREQALAAELETKSREHIAALTAARKAQDWAGVAAAAGNLAALHQKYAGAAIEQYAALVHLGDREKASTLGQDLCDQRFADDLSLLHFLAWSIVDPRAKFEPEERDLELALRAAGRADVLAEHENASVLDTLARVYFWKGDLKAAIETQSKAVDLAEGEEKETLGRTLAEYRQQS